MHNLFFQTAIARFLFCVENDEPVKPGKRKPSTRFVDSFGSVEFWY